MRINNRLHLQILLKTALLILLNICVIGNSVASEEMHGQHDEFRDEFRPLELAQEVGDWIKDFAAGSRVLSLQGIKAKWHEYLELRENARLAGLASDGSGDQEGENSRDLDLGLADYLNIDTDINRGASLKVFVSKSMGKNLLKIYAAEAAKYDAILVFNGLPNGSWLELSLLIQEIVDGREVAIQIDDEAFKTYGITSVPSFVLVDEDKDLVAELAALEESTRAVKYDKVSGNIGIRRALEIMAAEGELAETLKVGALK